MSETIIAAIIGFAGGIGAVITTALLQKWTAKATNEANFQAKIREEKARSTDELGGAIRTAIGSIGSNRSILPFVTDGANDELLFGMLGATHKMTAELNQALSIFHKAYPEFPPEKLSELNNFLALGTSRDRPQRHDDQAYESYLEQLNKQLAILVSESIKLRG